MTEDQIAAVDGCRWRGTLTEEQGADLREAVFALRAKRAAEPEAVDVEDPPARSLVPRSVRILLVALSLLVFVEAVALAFIG